MNGGTRSRITRLVIGAILGAAMVMAVVSTIVIVRPTAGAAHGATSFPASRVYTCRFEQPNNQMCAAAWAQNSQAMYDWMEVNIGDVGGQHQQRVPDGQLCSAGRSKYAALNTPSASWPITDLKASSRGTYRLEYTATAPHATAYFRFYLTRPGFNAASSPLRWSDLELVYDSGPAAGQTSYSWDVPLPTRDGHHILYTVWQRSDSPEAFYSCSDVRVLGLGDGGGPQRPDNDNNNDDGGGTGGTTVTTASVSTTTTAAPTTAPQTTARQTTTTLVSSTSQGSSTTTPDDSSTSSSNPDSSTTESTDSTSPENGEPEEDEQAVVTLLPGSSTAPAAQSASSGSLAGDGITPSLVTDPAIDRTDIIAYASLALSGLLAIAGLLILRWDRSGTTRRRW